MALDYKNPLEFIKFLGYLAPFLMTFVIICITIINGQPLKGFIYVGCVFILSTIIIGLTHVLKIPMSKAALYGCRMFGLDTYSVPSLSNAIMAFNFTYLWYPSYSTPNSPEISPFLIIFLVMMYALNALVKYTSLCTSFSGILSGTLFGIIWAWCCIAAIRVTSDNANSQMLLFSEILTNNEICTRPSEQKFQCKVYKNGELISTTNN